MNIEITAGHVKLTDTDPVPSLIVTFADHLEVPFKSFHIPIKGIEAALKEHGYILAKCDADRPF